LLGNGRGTLIDVDRPQLGDLALELGDRLFEVEIGAHGCRTVHGCVLPCLRGQRLGCPTLPAHAAGVKAPIPAGLELHRRAEMAPSMALLSAFFDPRKDCLTPAPPLPRQRPGPRGAGPRTRVLPRSP